MPAVDAPRRTQRRRNYYCYIGVKRNALKVSSEKNACYNVYRIVRETDGKKKNPRGNITYASPRACLTRQYLFICFFFCPRLSFVKKHRSDVRPGDLLNVERYVYSFVRCLMISLEPVDCGAHKTNGVYLFQNVSDTRYVC